MVGILLGAASLTPGAGPWIPVFTAAVLYAACVVSPVRRLFLGLDSAPHE
jgi:hypothetical protein